jgi:3-oxoadipate CoA-transferase beta subunit
MDLAIGAKDVYVMTTLSTSSGAPKPVPACTYPLTGAGAVSRICTDLAVFGLGPS